MVNSSAYGSNYLDQAKKSNNKWYRLSVEHSLVLPVSASFTRKRLQEAFAAPVTIFKQYLNLKFRYIEYTGALSGNNIDAFFTIFNTNSRYTYTYHVQGEIMEDLRGSRIRMTIPPEKTLHYFLRLLVVPFILFLFNQSVAGLIIMLLFFIIGGFIASKISYKIAATNIARVLNGLIVATAPSMNVQAVAAAPAPAVLHSAPHDLKTYLKGPKMFQHPFSCKGRIRRTEYAIGFIIHVVATQLVFMIGSYFDHERKVTVASFIILGILFLLVLSYSVQTIKRCHDCGKSGWWMLVPFYTLILLFEEGQAGSNKYGPDPKKVE